MKRYERIARHRDVPRRRRWRASGAKRLGFARGTLGRAGARIQRFILESTQCCQGIDPLLLRPLQPLAMDLDGSGPAAGCVGVVRV